MIRIPVIVIVLNTVIIPMMIKSIMIIIVKTVKIKKHNDSNSKNKDDKCYNHKSNNGTDDEIAVRK